MDSRYPLRPIPAMVEDHDSFMEGLAASEEWGDFVKGLGDLDHPGACRCDLCLAWWVMEGEGYGPFTNLEVVARLTAQQWFKPYCLPDQRLTRLEQAVTWIQTFTAVQLFVILALVIVALEGLNGS